MRSHSSVVDKMTSSVLAKRTQKSEKADVSYEEEELEPTFTPKIATKAYYVSKQPYISVVHRSTTSSLKKMRVKSARVRND